ncbi:MAG: endonuclease domain-containing protein, partial [Thermoanaerobaculia bacterium]|nr:endonuclease domain-containing protein [Thermoanaerobaculia bacterium]
MDRSVHFGSIRMPWKRWFPLTPTLSPDGDDAQGQPDWRGEGENIYEGWSVRVPRYDLGVRHQRREAPRIHERQLRAGQTEAERLVWNMLRDRRLGGLKFRRQHRIGEYILDFYCPRLRLAIELDGENHFTEG